MNLPLCAGEGEGSATEASHRITDVWVGLVGDAHRRRSAGGYWRFVWFCHGGHDGGGRLRPGLPRLLPPAEASHLPGTLLIFMRAYLEF